MKRDIWKGSQEGLRCRLVIEGLPSGIRPCLNSVLSTIRCRGWGVGVEAGDEKE